MAVGRVVVHDVGELEAFGSTLQLKRDEIEGLYGALLSECTRQETNWQDPQYTYLREEIESYAQASRGQLELLDKAVHYIAVLAQKLRDI